MGNCLGPTTEVEMGMKVDNMDVNDLVKTTGLRRKATLNVTFCVKKERNASFKKVSRILQKSENDRTEEEKEVLSTCSEVVKEVTTRLEKRKVLKARSEEVEDSAEVLGAKCEALARALRQARHLVVYSGAGVSTAACIPDYRGSNGIWTRLQQGLDIGQHDLSKTQPTLTHMVLYSLYRRGMLKHVVSQNCDGLHLRSGLPRAALSEVHGNMYLEVCQPCKLEYWRLFDVTEHTGRYSHATARRCYTCHKPLRDTIVHFGERGGLKWPINWSGATAAANQADVILCMGSSLKVLKKYPWLWGMDRPVKKRPSLYIINLQWTPKDDQAALKINGKCDEVMSLVMSKLGLPIPEYEPRMDPIFIHATRLHAVEVHTYSTAALEPPEEVKRLAEEENEVDKGKKVCAESGQSDSVTIKKEIEEETKTAAPIVDIIPEEKSNVKMAKKDEDPIEKKDGDSLIIPKKEEGMDSVDAKDSSNKPSMPEPKPEENIINDVKMKVINNNGENNQKIKEEPKAVDACKPVMKGIWRPFSFDDGGSSSSCSNVSKAVEIKTEPGLDKNLTLEPGKLTTYANNTENFPGVLTRCENSRIVYTNPKPIVLNENMVKKCVIQLEPLDLSCAKRIEPKVDNPYFCQYCRVHYHSGFCLFYRKQNSDIPPDPPCYCCDEEDEKDPTSPETEAKSPEDSDKSTAKVPITNPGWFGKGYRKKIRKKR